MLEHVTDPLTIDEPCVFQKAHVEALLATIEKLGQQRASRLPALRAQIPAVQLKQMAFAVIGCQKALELRRNSVRATEAHWFF